MSTEEVLLGNVYSILVSEILTLCFPVPVRVDIPDDASNTPLHMVIYGSGSCASGIQLLCSEKFLEIIGWLLDSGASPDCPNSEGITPFLLACQCNPAAALEILKVGEFPMLFILKQSIIFSL